MVNLKKYDDATIRKLTYEKDGWLSVVLKVLCFYLLLAKVTHV